MYLIFIADDKLTLVFDGRTFARQGLAIAS